MNKYAIIKNETVVNVVEYESQPNNPPPGFEDGYIAIQEDKVSPGWKYVNNEFFNPNPQQFIEIDQPSLTEQILSNPEELQKLKQALGLL